MKKLIYTSLFALLLPTMSYGQDQHENEHKHQHEHMQHADEHKMTSPVEMLSGDLRGLLIQEMQALQEGMMSIIPAYISGDWDQIAITAEKMKNSYILDQQLTDAQRKELESALPAEFIEKDEDFHYLAGMLEHVAENQKPELINFYFSRMNEACMSCHSSFATHKFPALTPEKKAGHSH